MISFSNYRPEQIKDDNVFLRGIAAVAKIV